MKSTPGRARLLQLLAQDGAHAYLDGFIPPRFISDGRSARLNGDVALLFERNGLISREPAPKYAAGRIYVWKITERGRRQVQSLSTG